MLPYIEIGDMRISTYYSAMVLGYVLMIVLMVLKHRQKKYGIGSIKAVLFATAQLICGVLGCKILFILENIAWVQKNGLTLGGFSFFGAVFLSPLLMPLVGRLLGLNLRNSLDCSAICILAMLGTIRIGCYLNGCCGGEVFNIGEYYFTLPTQLIECIFDFVLLVHLIKQGKKGTANGLLYPKFILFYSGARFFIEFLRNTVKDWMYLSHAQWFSIVAIIISIVLFIAMRKRKKIARKW